MIPHINYLSEQNVKSILHTLNMEDLVANKYNAGSAIQEKPTFYKIDDSCKIEDSSSIREIPNHILDPLSVIIKLAILSKKNAGCKLCIMNNVLYIQEPGMFQPFVRYLFSSTKEELSFLYNPIETACEYFLFGSANERKEMEVLFLLAQKGIQKLTEQYKDHTTIVHTLYMYHNLIMNHVGMHYNQDLFIRDDNTEAYQKEYIQELNEKWSEGKIKMVLDMLEFINRDDNTKKNVKCVEEFMVIVDKETTEFFLEKRRENGEEIEKKIEK